MARKLTAAYNLASGIAKDYNAILAKTSCTETEIRVTKNTENNTVRISAGFKGRPQRSNKSLLITPAATGRNHTLSKDYLEIHEAEDIKTAWLHALKPTISKAIQTDLLYKPEVEQLVEHCAQNGTSREKPVKAKKTKTMTKTKSETEPTSPPPPTEP